MSCKDFEILLSAYANDELLTAEREIVECSSRRLSRL